MRGAKRRALAWEVAFPAVEETACASDSCCVLVVDEEPEVSEMLAEILSLDGHQIETAPSGNVAMRILAERSVDVILSDHAHARCRRTGLAVSRKAPVAGRGAPSRAAGPGRRRHRE